MDNRGMHEIGKDIDTSATKKLSKKASQFREELSKTEHYQFGKRNAELIRKGTAGAARATKTYYRSGLQKELDTSSRRGGYFRGNPFQAKSGRSMGIGGRTDLRIGGTKDIPHNNTQMGSGIIHYNPQVNSNRGLIHRDSIQSKPHDLPSGFHNRSVAQSGFGRGFHEKINNSGFKSGLNRPVKGLRISRKTPLSNLKRGVI